jgi:predicted permease
MRLHHYFSRRKLNADLEEEMREHLDERTEELVGQGVPLPLARETAQREFGNFTLLEEQARDVWRWPRVEAMVHDISFAIRRLRHAPGFTLVSVLTLALGLGANFALFSLVQTVLLNPLPFQDPARLVMLYEAEASHATSSFNIVAAGSFADWQHGARSFEQMAIWSWATRNLSGEGGQLPEKLTTRKCTWNLFSTLGVQPAYGRFFSAGDDKPGAPSTTVLTWSLFQRRFAGNPAVIGRTILLNDEPYTVIGVLPSWFAYPDIKSQLWTPAYHDAPPQSMQSHGNHMWNVVARLKAGVNPAAAAAEIGAIQARIHKQFPGEPAGESAGIQPLLDDIVGPFKAPLYVLMAAVGCVLLITCLNLASLQLARSVARRKEIAVRSALGGSAWRIMQEQIFESLLLAFGGGLLAAGVAYGLIRWTIMVRDDMPRTESIHVDMTFLAFSAGLTALTGLLAGILPATSFRSNSLLNSLQESSRSVRGGRSRATLRTYLVGIEMAFTAVLLIGAGLLLKSFIELRSVPLGCTTKNVLTMSLSLSQARYQVPSRAASLLDTLLTRIRAFPGVQSAGAISTPPGGGYSGDTMFAIPEHPIPPKGKFQFAIFRGADPQAFRTLEIPVLRGRTFTNYDRQDKASRAIISASFVKQFFPNEDPIGKHLRVNWGSLTNFEIIGVVGDTPYRVTQPIEPMMYFPIENGFPEFSLIVRTVENPLGVALPVQKLVAELDRSLGVANILTLDEVVGQSLASHSFETIVVTGFAALSLLLASIGLYGVLSYVVTQRTSEIGIRIALGAQRGALIRTTLWEGIRPAAVGLVFGVAGGIASARLMRSILFGTAPIDVSVFVAASSAILFVAALACVLPAVRASGIDPIIALRTE